MNEPEPIDESMLRWRVRSFSNRKDKRELREYLVQLRTQNGLNHCTCEHFDMRIQPMYNAALKASIPRNKIELQRCKHIKLVEERFKELMLDAMFEREKKISSI